METSKKDFDIRQLRASDAQNYRAVLIEALIVHPDCYPEDYTSELSRPLAETENELESNRIFGVWYGDVLAGIASVFTCRGSKRRHCGRVRNLYVKEHFRRRGFASALLCDLLRSSACDVDQLEAEIPANCENVIRLFERFGFRMCGLLPNGLRLGSENLDIWTMTRMVER
jgi:GNAT superfamily N-acetyltransferase